MKEMGNLCACGH